jgi:hypothetical protein
LLAPYGCSKINAAGWGSDMRGTAINCILLAVLCSSKANASFDTGNDVLRFCTNPSSFNQGTCYGMISGYFDAMRLAYSCPNNPGVSRQQIRDLVVKDLLADPAQRHLPGYILAVASFVKAFGCTPST